MLSPPQPRIKRSTELQSSIVLLPVQTEVWVVYIGMELVVVSLRDRIHL